MLNVAFTYLLYKLIFQILLVNWRVQWAPMGRKTLKNNYKINKNLFPPIFFEINTSNFKTFKKCYLQYFKTLLKVVL